uniref:FAS1 domain-containing protein n=1 Tax=Vespula pensylvanica TaxID=30213 RepID=A0A834JYY9_VESPE|nr:hypothetical protein H0235_016630 [Vespula pensylvanica]
MVPVKLSIVFSQFTEKNFYQLLETSQVANNTLTYRHVTVFAPTNRAFQKYNGSKSNLVLYHMYCVPYGTYGEFSRAFIDVYTDRNPVFQLVHWLTNIQPFSLNSFAGFYPSSNEHNLYPRKSSNVTNRTVGQ